MLGFSEGGDDGVSEGMKLDLADGLGETVGSKDVTALDLPLGPALGLEDCLDLLSLIHI